jgi:hypothetical protein
VIDYTATETLMLKVSTIIAQSIMVKSDFAAGKLNQLGAYENEYGKIIPIGKPQRKILVGMILPGDVIEELTAAFAEARASDDGKALLAKITANETERTAGQQQATN